LSKVCAPPTSPAPLEFGPGGKAETSDPSFDLVAGDFVELAGKLDA
jgi:hypothetical protein